MNFVTFTTAYNDVRERLEILATTYGYTASFINAPNEESVSAQDLLDRKKKMYKQIINHLKNEMKEYE